MTAIGSTPGLIIGVGVGAAASAALEPAIEVPKQEAWAAAPNRLPDVGLIARLVAAGEVSQASGRSMAARLGFGGATFDAITYLAQTRPEWPELLALWRRFTLPDPNLGSFPVSLVDAGLAHAGLDWDYAAWLKALRYAELPGIGDVAYGVVRGILPAPSWVPVAPPTSGTSVPRFPQVDIDPVQLAAALGFDENMLRLMVGRSGLSLAPGLAATALFRGEINHADYLLAIAEGDLRTEWADTLLAASRLVPTPGEFMELALRGWMDVPTAEAGAGLHGMTPAHADLLYKLRRRPLTVANITKALARGGTFNPQQGEIQDPYSASVHQADLGPEWYDLAEHLKYSYPSAFVLRALAQAGDLGGTAEVEQILLEIGWKPDLAAKVATSWTGGAAVVDPHVTKAQTQLWTTLHRSYLADEADDATATAALGKVGVAAGAIPTVLSLWQEERSLVRKQLTPAQIKKAYKNADTNPATGAAWTFSEAQARLVGMGYSVNDATTFLEE